MEHARDEARYQETLNGQWVRYNMSMAANMTHLYDGSMLWQKHV